MNFKSLSHNSCYFWNYLVIFKMRPKLKSFPQIKPFNASVPQLRPFIKLKSLYPNQYNLSFI